MVLPYLQFCKDSQSPLLSLRKVGRMVYTLTRLLLEEHLFRVAPFVMLNFLDTLLFCTTELIVKSI